MIVGIPFLSADRQAKAVQNAADRADRMRPPGFISPVGRLIRLSGAAIEPVISKGQETPLRNI
jgi:hypothetical protein